MKIKFLLLFLLLSNFIVSSAFARVGLNLSLIYKKGNDKGLVLVSELHSRVEVDEHEEVALKMKNGTMVILKIQFVRSNETFGPSSIIDCDAKFFNQKGSLLKTVSGKEIRLNIGQERIISYEDNEGQLIELKITPDIL